jgi:D-serine deaminase-like pyridoxal phosphate-dependent protein
MRIRDLPTPAAIVDLDVVETNAAAMSGRARTLGVALRPHVKTHKCVEAARIQLTGLPRAVTVSTLAEAEAFAAAGFDDITYAVPLAPHRSERVLDLGDKIERLAVVVDHPDTLAAAENAARRRGARMAVFLKVDCGYHRAGVDPNAEAAVDLAASVADSPNLEFRGVLAHAGHAYAARDRDEIRGVARQERDVTAAFADRVRDRGIGVTVVSIGSTPTMAVADDLDGIDEIRPGNYLFFDGFQAAIGSCEVCDVALHIVASVVGSYPDRGAVVLDAGGTALSHDPGPRHVDPNCGYGAVLDLDGRAIGRGLRIASISQEHGRIDTDPDTARALAPGSRVRIVPNHACMAAGLFDLYHVARGDRVVERWSPIRGW